MLGRKRRSALTAALFLCLALVPLASADGTPGLPAWGTEPSPNVGVLNGLSVRTASDIWAVGHSPGLEYASRTLHYDGTAWTLVPSPNLDDGVRLQDVVAIAPDDAWAVGFARNPSSLDDRNVAMHWDGTAWTIVPTPQPGGQFADRLLAVDAVASNDVWAVGVFDTLYPASSNRSLTLHWDGTEWRVVPRGGPILHRFAPQPCDTYGGLAGITVVSPTDIWAVGDATTCHYDGTSWQEVPSPQPEYPELAYPLEDVSAVSSDDVWAVGARITDTPYTVAWGNFAEHWDGQQWTRVRQLGDAIVLLGVEAVASNDVWAVGRNDYGPRILHYDGSTWSDVATPEWGRAGRLAGVDSSAPNDLWAVGDYQLGTLIEHAPSSSQGAVVGDTNVSFATVSWFGPENGSTETNPFGEYEVGGLTAGTYTFTATEPGCAPDSRAVTVTAGQTREENFLIGCGSRRPGRQLG